MLLAHGESSLISAGYWLMPCGARLACMLLMLARMSSAQSSGQDSGRAAVVTVVSVLGAAGGLILTSIVFAHLWKWFKKWREAPIVKSDATIEGLNWHVNIGQIPFTDIEFQDSDLYRLLHNDDIETTPRGIEGNNLKR